MTHNGRRIAVSFVSGEDARRFAEHSARAQVLRDIAAVLQDPGFPEFVAEVERLVQLSGVV